MGCIIVVILLFICGINLFQCELMPSKYYSYEEMTIVLKTIQKEHPEVARLYSIGRTFKGRELWVIEISTGKNTFLRPNVKLIGNIHGNEPVGKEILLHFAKHLLELYDREDRQVRQLLEFARIHILPSLNPDGFSVALNHSHNGGPHRCRSGPGRNNALDQTLNKNFPDFHRGQRVPLQLETEAVMGWLQKTPFVLSASLYSGALVASYPFDNYKLNRGRSSEGHPTPDDDVFQHLAKLYAQTHPTMHLGEPCAGSSDEFTDGITNGAAWYPLTGSMQDYNYLAHGCMELTLEISCCKFPDASELPKYWEENKQPLMSFVEEVRRTVRGVVVDSFGVGIVNASVFIHGREEAPVHTTAGGQFFRVLLPNLYILQVEAKGYHHYTEMIKITPPNPDKWSQFINITLYPIESSTNHPNQATWTNASELEESPVKNVFSGILSDDVKFKRTSVKSLLSGKLSNSTESSYPTKMLNSLVVDETATKAQFSVKSSLQRISGGNLTDISVNLPVAIASKSLLTKCSFNFVVICFWAINLLS